MHDNPHGTTSGVPEPKRLLGRVAELRDVTRLDGRQAEALRGEPRAGRRAAAGPVLEQHRHHGTALEARGAGTVKGLHRPVEVIVGDE
ncbi:MAG: hypothetical protein ACYSXF_08905, partial [Planctomycetota bacterium]